MSTLQQIFDRVALHLLRQNERSSADWYEHPRCMYRGPNGLKCAVGFLIADEAYQPELEGRSVNNMAVLAALEDSGVPVMTMQQLGHMLLQLQGVHDGCPLPTWRKKLEEIAKKYDLTMPALAGEMLPATEERDEPAPAAREVAGAL